MQKHWLIALLCGGLIAACPLNAHGRTDTPTVEAFVDGSKLWERAPYIGRYHEYGLCVAVTRNFNSSFGLETDLGGGVDAKVWRSVWVRPIQVDYLREPFPSAPGSVYGNYLENNLQLSAGFVVRFGSRRGDRKQ